MKSLSYFSLCFLAGYLVLFASSCDPECGDGQIEADLADATFPTIYWEVTQATMTPDGPISSIRLIDADDETVFFDEGDVVTVTLVASDLESGISSIDVVGGFGITCSGPGGANALSGIFPELPDTYPLVGNCAQVEAKYADIVIDGPNLCPVAATPDLTQAGYQLNGIAENHGGLIRLITLNVIYSDGGS